MAKLLGRLARLALVAGAAAAAVSYYRQYSEFHRDLDEEFHDYEEDGESDHAPHTETPNRNYVSLNANRGEFTAAAQNTLEAAKGMVTSAAGMLKDVGNILADNLQAASGEKVADAQVTAETAAETVHETAEAAAEDAETAADNAAEEITSENILAKSYAAAGSSAKRATEITEEE